MTAIHRLSAGMHQNLDLSRHHSTITGGMKIVAGWCTHLELFECDVSREANAFSKYTNKAYRRWGIVFPVPCVSIEIIIFVGSQRFPPDQNNTTWEKKPPDTQLEIHLDGSIISGSCVSVSYLYMVPQCQNEQIIYAFVAIQRNSG